LKLYQALFGFDKIITHLDGRKLHISSSSKTDVNMFRKIGGEGMKSLNNTKGDMFIRFTMVLPNLTNLPLDTKNNIKNVLQTFDKNEVSIENNVKTAQNLVKTVVSDCKPEHCEMLLNLINKMNDNDNSEEHQQENMQGQPQCVQQ
jgi:DnaJ-class molecular chaperone